MWKHLSQDDILKSLPPPKKVGLVHGILESLLLAPASFQTLMGEMLKGLLDDKCMVYLDDILIMGWNFVDRFVDSMNLKFTDIRVISWIK